MAGGAPAPGRLHPGETPIVDRAWPASDLGTDGGAGGCWSAPRKPAVARARRPHRAAARPTPHGVRLTERAAGPTHLPAPAPAAGHRAGDMDALLSVPGRWWRWPRPTTARRSSSWNWPDRPSPAANAKARALLEPLAAGGRSAPGTARRWSCWFPPFSDDDALPGQRCWPRGRSCRSERARLLAAAQAATSGRRARRPAAWASVATEASQDALLLLGPDARLERRSRPPPAHPGGAARCSEDRPRLPLEAPMPGREGGTPPGSGAPERVARHPRHPWTKQSSGSARAAAIEHGYEPLLAGRLCPGAGDRRAAGGPARIRCEPVGSRPGSSGAEPLRRLAKLLLAEGTAAESGLRHPPSPAGWTSPNLVYRATLRPGWRRPGERHPSSD